MSSRHQVDICVSVLLKEKFRLVCLPNTGCQGQDANPKPCDRKYPFFLPPSVVLTPKAVLLQGRLEPSLSITRELVRSSDSQALSWPTKSDTLRLRSSVCLKSLISDACWRWSSTRGVITPAGWAFSTHVVREQPREHFDMTAPSSAKEWDGRLFCQVS